MSDLMPDVIVETWPRLRHEPTDRRIRALLNGDVVVDSTRVVLVWEPWRIVPSYAVPAEDVRAALTPGSASENRPDGTILHPGIPFARHSTPGTALDVEHAGQVRAGAAFQPADPDLAGLVVLDFGGFDTWLEEDDELVSHVRDPYHRIEVRPSSRELRIEANGRLLVHTTRPTLVFETQLPTRYYVPRDDVVASVEPSRQVSACAYKGVASYWTVGGVTDVAWSYEQPLPDATRLAGLLGFWNELVDITVDGRRLARPNTRVSRVLVDEFKLAV
jgi:uncharacterized protein (DUF427 family)